MINKKRLIITSIISILLVSTLFLGSTYSIFTSQDIDEDTHVYKTGNLDVTYTLSESEYIIEDSFPIVEDVVSRIKPYRITVTNTGNVTYQFDLKIDDTTASEPINYQYIKTKVGKLESKRLSNCTNNIIKEDVILLPGKSVDIDVRIWVSNDVANTEMGKAFAAKLSVDGLAIYNDNQEIDNSMLADPFVYLNSVEPGSYVKYNGTNGCDNTNTVNGYTSCMGKNANYVSDTNKGYCHSSSYPFNVNGWRIGYIENGNVHLISAGATDCMCTSSDGTVYSISCSSGLSTADYYKQIDNLDNLALKYCNKDYVKGGICNNSTVWAMDDLDFQKITGNDITSTCYTQSNTACGIGNDLIDNGSYYHLAKQNGTVGSNYMWNPYSPANIYHSYGSSNYIAGMRPVISLASTVRITGGTGTYTDPYLIAN